VVASATRYQEILGALYGALEGRGTELYRWDPSDAWERARIPLEWSGHLQCWFQISGEVDFNRASYEHAADFIFGCRWHPDDDSQSQARLCAAAVDAVEALLTADLPHECRVQVVDGWRVDPSDLHAGWVTVILSFQLHVPTDKR